MRRERTRTAVFCGGGTGATGAGGAGGTGVVLSTASGGAGGLLMFAARLSAFCTRWAYKGWLPSHVLQLQGLVPQTGMLQYSAHIACMLLLGSCYQARSPISHARTAWTVANRCFLAAGVMPVRFLGDVSSSVLFWTVHLGVGISTAAICGWGCRVGGGTALGCLLATPAHQKTDRYVLGPC